MILLLPAARLAGAIDVYTADTKFALDTYSGNWSGGLFTSNGTVLANFVDTEVTRNVPDRMAATP